MSDSLSSVAQLKLDRKKFFIFNTLTFFCLFSISGFFIAINELILASIIVLTGFLLIVEFLLNLKKFDNFHIVEIYDGGLQLSDLPGLISWNYIQECSLRGRTLYISVKLDEITLKKFNDELHEKLSEKSHVIIPIKYPVGTNISLNKFCHLTTQYIKNTEHEELINGPK